MTTTPQAPAARPLPRTGRLDGVRSRVQLLSPAEPAPADGRFPWLVVGACTWILVGLFLDGWFHINRPGGESFFTPWHAILYSGVGAALGVHLWEQQRLGGLRPGYGLSLVGGLVVLSAGALDGIWHTLLGVEVDLEALLSPPHLLLITAGTLVFAGPLRAALQAPAGARGGLPTALSAAFTITGLGFFVQYVTPITELYPVVQPGASPDLVELRQVAGVAGVVLWSALVGGAVAVLRGRTTLVPGSLLVAVTVPCAFLTTQRGTYVLLPAILLAGVTAEVAGRALRPAALAALTTGVLATGWVLTLVLARDVQWSEELLSGAVCSAAAAGFLVGWLVQTGAAPRPAGAPVEPSRTGA
jgi:hypothetical protein